MLGIDLRFFVAHNSAALMMTNNRIHFCHTFKRQILKKQWTFNKMKMFNHLCKQFLIHFLLLHTKKIINTSKKMTSADLMNNWRDEWRKSTIYIKIRFLFHVYNQIIKSSKYFQLIVAGQSKNTAYHWRLTQSHIFCLICGFFEHKSQPKWKTCKKPMNQTISAKLDNGGR